MPEDCMELIDRLIEERHRQGKSQRQLAGETQLSQSAIARLESKRATPQLDTLVKIVSALGCRLILEPIESSSERISEDRTPPIDDCLLKNEVE